MAPFIMANFLTGCKRALLNGLKSFTFCGAKVWIEPLEGVANTYVACVETGAVCTLHKEGRVVTAAVC